MVELLSGCVDENDEVFVLFLLLLVVNVAGVVTLVDQLANVGNVKALLGDASVDHEDENVLLVVFFERVESLFENNGSLNDGLEEWHSGHSVGE